MAEIEFKRRGTPLWAVLLALVVVALVVWYFVAGRGTPPAATAPGRTATQTPPPAAPAPTRGAPAAGPVAEYVTFVDERPAPSGAAVTTYVADGLHLLAGALEQKYPSNGVQVNLVRAMADSLRMPNVPATRQTDMAQAAFFATAFAMGRGGAGDEVNTAAAQVQLNQPLAQQVRAVRGVFQAARDVLEKPPAAAGAPATPGKS